MVGACCVRSHDGPEGVRRLLDARAVLFFPLVEDHAIAGVIEDGRRFRRTARGYALGSGNSIPDYVPVDGYLAMIEGVRVLRQEDPLTF